MRSFFLSFISGDFVYDVIPSHRRGVFVVEVADSLSQYLEVYTTSEVDSDILASLLDSSESRFLGTSSSRYHLTPKQSRRLLRYITLA